MKTNPWDWDQNIPPDTNPQISSSMKTCCGVQFRVYYCGSHPGGFCPVCGDPFGINGGNGKDRPKWIKAVEYYPKPNRPCIVLTCRKGWPFLAFYGKGTDGGEYWFDPSTNESVPEGEITHWQPVFEPEKD